MVILRVARVKSPLANLMGEGILIVVKLWLGEILKGRLIINWQLRAEFENLQIGTPIKFRVAASGANRTFCTLYIFALQF